jgi:hypothetical protein
LSSSSRHIRGRKTSISVSSSREAGLLAHAQRRRRGLGHQRRVAEGGQLVQPDAVRVHLDQLAGHSEPESGLADPAAAGECQQARPAQQTPDLVDLALASDEAGELAGEIVGVLVERPEWRELGR